MKLRLPYRLAAAAGLCLSSLGYAQGPARLPSGSPTATVVASPDQKLANTIAERLAQAPHLRGYQVDIVVINGSVDLTGALSQSVQRDDILRIARGVPGVGQVHDHLTMQAEIQPVNADGPLAPPVPMNGGMQGGPMIGGMQGGPMIGAPGLLPGAQGAIDPVPLGGPGAGAVLHPPAMPPYAWPTYAPYNNYSRVAYPEQYPAAAFPFIGPFYPFPKVPLGYRAIKLEWEDGHWYYGRTSVKHDFWTVRYW